MSQEATKCSATACPLCGGENACRVANGTLYKGPCWCSSVEVPQHILKRLVAEFPEPACLCHGCLETIGYLARKHDSSDKIISEAKRLAAEPDYYVENGLTVFTERYHLRRGNCCASGCRHCPY